MHVLLICEYASLNGGERSLLCSLDALAGRDIRFTAVAPPTGALADALNDRGISVQSIHAADDTDHPSVQRTLREKLGVTIARIRPDIVHANSLSMSRLSGPVCSNMGVPSVGHLRDIIKVSRQAVVDLNQHARLLAVSEATRSWHVAHGLDAERTKVLYNGVNVAEFRPRASNGFLHRELGLPTDARIIGTIGQIGMRKGIDVLLAAGREILIRCPDVQIVVVGERLSQKQEAIDYERNLKRMANSEPLTGHVHFFGVRTDVSQLLNEFSVLVHAARQEPLGRVLLEAAASGTAVLATDVGGTGEIFPPQTASAQLVPADDQKAISESLLRLLENEDLRRDLGRRARCVVEAKFADEPVADKLVSHYHSIMPNQWLD
jgi:glycosyltransferase involved in cell wall biosynthesis